MEIPIKPQIENSKRILLCGMGGGYDIYSGIPLFFTLKKLGKEVILANLSFSFLVGCGGKEIFKNVWLINEHCKELDYFPEKFLFEWLKQKGEFPAIIAFSKTGVIPLKVIYQNIIEQYNIDTIILVDGGTDSLMRGNEAGLGTPVEDIISLVAAHNLNLSTKILLSVGFGIDHFHGVCHSQFLQNVATLIENDGFYGVNTFTKSDQIGQLFLEVVQYANQRAKDYPSIVINSVANAVEGKFGNYHATNRTKGSSLYINPIMSFHWYFCLEKVANQLLYFNQMKYTKTIEEVIQVIKDVRKVIPHKDWENMPY